MKRGAPLRDRFWANVASAPQFTPGPWYQWGSQRTVHAGKSDGRIAYSERIARIDDCDEAVANARLIAASPKMIDALQRVADCEDGVISEAVHEIVLEAIDEALGRSNSEGLMDMGGFAI